MKVKSFIIIAAAAMFTACNKEYTCDCKTTYKQGTSSDTYSNESKAYSSKMSKKQAEAACKREEEMLEESHKDLISNFGSLAGDLTVTSECSLK